MNSCKYKLLVTDVDGTLIDKEGVISSENREALAAARKAGVRVSLSTGRSIQSCLPYLKELGLDSYHIFYDGALVYSPSTGEHVYIHFIKPEIIKEMSEFVRDNDINVEFATVEHYYSERETWSTDVKRRYFNIDTTIGNTTELWKREKIIRADMAITSPAEEARAQQFIRHFKDKLQFSEAHSERYPNVVFLNIIAPGLSKGKALEALTAHLSISLEEVIAIGDWTNDISMLSIAGLGVAMGNARPELKAVADYITLDVEDSGLAAAIEKFVI